LWYNIIAVQRIVVTNKLGGNKMPEKHKPGEIAKKSGQYPIIGPRGGNTGKERTVVKGEPFPPTPKKGDTYGTPDKTKH
jgi:hypothetical protein